MQRLTYNHGTHGTFRVQCAGRGLSATGNYHNQKSNPYRKYRFIYSNCLVELKYILTVVKIRVIITQTNHFLNIEKRCRLLQQKKQEKRNRVYSIQYFASLSPTMEM